MKTKNHIIKKRDIKKPALIFTCLIIALLTLTFFNLSFYFFSKPKISYVSIDNYEEKISFWRTFLIAHPNYFEGWIQLAELEQQNGEQIKAQVALSNAIRINPNSEEINLIAAKIKK